MSKNKIGNGGNTTRINDSFGAVTNNVRNTHNNLKAQQQNKPNQSNSQNANNSNKK